MSIPFDGGGDPNLLKIAAARVIACDRMPYLAVAMFAMVPVRVPGLGTLASDDRWRLYWDPVRIAEWPVEQVAGVLLHEVMHCVRGHGARFTALGEPLPRHALFNKAGDVLINADLRDEHVPLPEFALYVEHLPGTSREMSAEQIYRILVEQALQACTCPQQGQSGEGQSGEGQSGEGGKPAPGTGSKGSKGTSGKGPSGKGEGGNSPCPVHGQPAGWDCGSAADGVRREYEAEGDKVDPGVDPDRADLIRQQVAVAVTEHVRTRGSVPAGLERWAKDLLEPVVDWRRELSALVRRSFAAIAGMRDYSYRRPSRRQAAMRGTGQGVILPAMRQPEPPVVSLVIDTSGSVSDEMLGWALSETQGVLRSVGSGQRGMRVYSCDAQAEEGKRVRSASQVRLTGGGGTDMRVGISAAATSHPKPDVIIVITDGYTPWPDEPVKGTTLIVALSDEAAADAVPPWAKKVVITR